MSTKTQFLLISLMSWLFFMPIACAEPPAQEQESSQSIVLKVEHMTCAMCKFTIKKALSAINGTKKVSVNFDNKTTTVSFNPQKTNSQALVEAITNAGYPATLQPVRN